MASELGVAYNHTEHAAQMLTEDEDVDLEVSSPEDSDASDAETDYSTITNQGSLSRCTKGRLAVLISLIAVLCSGCVWLGVSKHTAFRVDAVTFFGAFRASLDARKQERTDLDFDNLTANLTVPDRCATVEDSPNVTVVSYNLFWWCVSDIGGPPNQSKWSPRGGPCPANMNGKGFDRLYATIHRQHPFDLIGLQESDNTSKIIRHSGYERCMQWYNPLEAGDPKKGTDAPLAFNTRKYTMIENGTSVIGGDMFGDRRVNWVRLKVVQTGGTIFFGNTHGPLGKCDGDEALDIGTNYANVVLNNSKDNDVIIFTGDFNCGAKSDTIKQFLKVANLSTAVEDHVYGGADHIFMRDVGVLWHKVEDGEPSDHQLIKAKLRLPFKLAAVSQARPTWVLPVIGISVFAALAAAAFGVARVTLCKRRMRKRSTACTDSG
eukprot:TRINITY_DN28396_c0_g1_i1.p1 TRINITY_DN28396_c0_g1~~TRINITY_DN28396_c0_g1_i1.p1  ORF type:complete len:434 (-),score=49.98 TRINITY_DN28396_c0_g1_i1:393-1694(-)